MKSNGEYTAISVLTVVGLATAVMLHSTGFAVFVVIVAMLLI